MKSLLIGNGLNLANRNTYLSIDEIKKRFFKNLEKYYSLFQEALYLDNLDYKEIYLYVSDNCSGIEQLAGNLYEYMRQKVTVKRKFDYNDNYRTVELIIMISLQSLFIIDHKFIKPKVDGTYVKKISDYNKIFTLNYVESWDINHRCIYLHGNICHFFDNYNDQDITTNILIHNPEIKDKFKDRPILIDSREIVFVPFSEHFDKNSYVGEALYSSDDVYPADDLFPRDYKDIYAKVNNIESLDIFGVSPFGDKSLIEKLRAIPNITIYVYKQNIEEINEWKKFLPNADYKDSLNFLD